MERTLLRAIENGPDAVRLSGPNGPVDLVGYGACSSPCPCEGAPAEDVPPGFSLVRKPDGADTDRNDVDFVRREPTPGTANFHEIDLAVELPVGRLLPCELSIFRFFIRILNTGLRRATGSVDITVTTGGGEVWSETRAVVSIDGLECDRRDSTAVQISSSQRGLMTITAAINYEHDLNRTNDTLSVPVWVSPSTLVVNEIMYRPKPDGSEWIELLNTGARSLDLAGWEIGDATGSGRIVSSNELMIEPGGFLVLARYPERLIDSHPPLAAICHGVEGGWPRLNDSGDDFADEVMLFGTDGFLVERVRYTDLSCGEYGRSIERISADVCSGIPGGIWHRSCSRTGSTPGSLNSIGAAPVAGGVSADPNPFCEGRHGETVIATETRTGETGFVIRIFSMDGREVCRLLGESGGARRVACGWNGRGDDGRPVGTGLYVCHVEFVTMGGRVCRRERCCIAVVGPPGD